MLVNGALNGLVRSARWLRETPQAVPQRLREIVK